MPQHWLYPLSSKSGHWFEFPGGRTPDTGPASFEEMIQKFATDDEWGAHKNWRNVRPGDYVWVYYGSADGDLGIVGLGAAQQVVSPTDHSGRARIVLRWDRGATLQLLRNPVPAGRVREFIPRPRGAVWAVPPQLARQLVRHSDVAPKGKLPKYASAIASTISYTPAHSVKVNLRHDALLRPFERRFISAGWTTTELHLGTKRADLVMKRARDLHLIEAKTVGESSNKVVREAFAQLAEYAWIYAKANQKPLSLTKWALFEKEPSIDEVAFLEAHGVMTSWASRSKRRFFHGPNTARHAFELGL